MSSSNEDESSWKTSDFTKLHRFLCFGSEQPVYCADQVVMSEDRLGIVQRLIDNGEGSKVIDTIKRFVDKCLSCNPKAIIYALALCAKACDEATKKYAYANLPTICKTPDELFLFLEYAKKLSLNPTEGVGARGWGNTQRKAVSKWYNGKEPLELAQLVSQYRHRHNWSQQDVLRLTHVKAGSIDIGLVLSYVVNPKKILEQTDDSLGVGGKQALTYLKAVESVRHADDITLVATVTEEHRLHLEHIPTKLHKERKIWRALLRADLSLCLVLQHFPVMAALGMFDGDGEDLTIVKDKLGNVEALKKDRVQPLDVLKTLLIYKKGQNSKGKLKWTVNSGVVDILIGAHQTTIKNTDSTNQRHLVAIDLSEKMTKADKHNSCSAQVAMTVAMTIAQTETGSEVVTFKDKDVTCLGVTAQTTFEEGCALVETLSKSGCSPLDCTQPITWALNNKKPFDMFVVFTASTTTSTPARDVLLKYRREMGIFAKLIVCTVPHKGSCPVADPGDAGMLDIRGLTPECMQAIRNMALGDL